MDTYVTMSPLGSEPDGKKSLQVAIARSDFDFRPLSVDGVRVTARRLLEIAGFAPAEEFLLFRLNEDGTLQECRLEDSIALSDGKLQRFIAFKSDRSFRVVIDGRRFEWGQSALSGLIAKQLAGVDPEGTKLWQEGGNGADVPVENTDIIKLAEEGVERLRTARLFPLCIEGVTFQWPSPTITTEEIAELGGWDPSEGVQWVDLATNEVRTLKPGELVDLRSISDFIKKVGFRRG